MLFAEVETYQLVVVKVEPVHESRRVRTDFGPITPEFCRPTGYLRGIPYVEIAAPRVAAVLVGKIHVEVDFAVVVVAVANSIGRYIDRYGLTVGERNLRGRDGFYARKSQSVYLEVGVRGFVFELQRKVLAARVGGRQLMLSV